MSWEEVDNAYQLKCPEGSAKISTSFASRMNILIVRDKEGKAIDGCSSTDPLELLQSRAERTLRKYN